MITVEQALAEVKDRARPLAARELSLIECRGRVLVEDARATADEPPFDKSLVDGFALRAADLDESPVLGVGETILAGHTPSRPLGRREAAVIMTGGPIPEQADAVVKHEDVEPADGRVRFPDPARPGQNVLRRGRVHREGDVVLAAGTRLSAAGLGLLASTGRTSARVIPRPRLAILSTGDELVEPGQVPGPGQIRNSNAVMLQSLALDQAAEARLLPIARDEPEALATLLRQGLDHDLLVITGGVSAGQRDLVPGVLEGLGVRPVFHKVRLKPGKPLWFGVGPARGECPGPLVFGLPGNPASSLVGFVLFVAPAIRALTGLGFRPPRTWNGRLAARFEHRGDRPTYHPARWLPAEDPDAPGTLAPLEWSGSADLAAIARADGFAVFPGGNRVHEAGDVLPFLPLSRSSE